MIREILHLLSKDNLLVQALSECYEMMDLCHRMVHASVKSLRESDAGGNDTNIPELDKKLNSFERDVRRKVMTHLSLGQRADISSGLVLVSIVIDIERIGDYTKNIHALANQHPKRLSAGGFEEALKEIEKNSLSNFDRTVNAFKSGNLDEARAIMEEYKDEISRPCAQMEEDLVGGKTDLNTGDAVAVALYLRYLKRISAHSRNLISSLVNPFDRIGYPAK